MLAALLLVPAAGRTQEVWHATIHRDEWGVPHVYGETDADAVYGGGYAQAEDNCAQIEENFVRAVGRGAEQFGEAALLDDYLVRGLEIPRRSRREYRRAPRRTRRLYDAFAAGVNDYIAAHPDGACRLLGHVEPWYPLALIRFKYHHNEFLRYAGLTPDEARRAMVHDAVGALDTVALSSSSTGSLAWTAPRDPDGARALGSNEWAVSGARTRSGYPMLLINPHVSFFGISTYTEVHLVSEAGLDFSGLTRFGFVLPYMGNSSVLAWAYTDNYGDHGDLYAERLDADGVSYRYGDGWRELRVWIDTIRVKTASGVEDRVFRYRGTRHGPILGLTDDGRPLAVRLAGLDEGGWFAQWYAMIRARGLEEWRAAVARLDVNYMNALYADTAGNIFYVYGSTIPRRSAKFDWSTPVDGTDPDTEWRSVHPLEDLPRALNPASGYLANTNSTPFSVTEGLELDPDDYPTYMIGDETDNRRARNSRRILRSLDDLTLGEFARAALDTHLIAADEWLDALIAAQRRARRTQPELAKRLEGPVAALAAWDRIASQGSVATTLFVLWANSVNPDSQSDRDRWLPGLAAVLDRLEAGWGTWEVPWGEVNRIQRPDAAGRRPFSDSLPSLPATGAPGWLGSIFVLNARQPRGSRRRYGVHGNSFVKVVEMTPTPRARSVFVFGQSGDPGSPHYFDQARLYSEERFKPAWFANEDVSANEVREYEVP